MKEESFKKAWNKSLRYLSYRPRSKKELKDYLLKNEFDNKNIDMVIEVLEERSLLDDAKYTRDWIDYSFRNGKGALRISRELKNKGISEEIITDALNDLISDDGEIKRAQECIKKYLPEVYDKNDIKLLKRSASFLIRRGFSNDIIYKTTGGFFNFY